MRHNLPWYGALICLITLIGNGAGATPLPPSVEFDTPYELRVIGDGSVLEVSGSFSWALPQTFQSILADSPRVRVVRLESPGGQLAPAIEIAAIIQERNLDTYVGRLCASACTVAFLGGHHRWLGSGARLGFHQAHGPGIPADQANALLSKAYQDYAVPALFIAHVLRIPPADIWYPAQDELLASRLTTGIPPASLPAVDAQQVPRLDDLSRQLPAASDDVVMQFAAELSDLVESLQKVDPEICWSFAHEGPDIRQSMLPQVVVDAITAAQGKLTEARGPGPIVLLDAEQRRKEVSKLVAALRTKGQMVVLEGLRNGAPHAAFCPSLRKLLQSLLASPDPDRVMMLRALLQNG